MKRVKYLFALITLFAALVVAGLVTGYEPLIRTGSANLIGFGIGAILWTVYEMKTEAK